jgi:hypothetical protein
MIPKVRTANGEIILSPIFCEITGKQIAWTTDAESVEGGIMPAYISFEVIDESGNQKQSLEDITTF